MSGSPAAENTGLYESRVAAAQVTLGTSPDAIKNLVVRLIRDHKLTGRVLDFGAGKGELARLLLGVEGITEVTGVDILDWPEDLPPAINWRTQDLNEPFEVDQPFDIVTCTEVIEHLENPRATFRNLARLVRPGGHLILTTPNQECIRSYVGLLFGGHFTHFLGSCYPAHITALLRLDLTRICAETGFEPPTFAYSREGGIPKMPVVKWQSVSFGLLNGRLFSDNVGMIARRRAE
ncbi:MAG: methyltransferase domain-containing protein [Isosphaeraceae bacterium]